MKIPFIATLIIFCACAFLPGCASDARSLKHAEQGLRNAEQDLNAGHSQEEITVIIAQAFDIAYPPPAEPVLPEGEDVTPEALADYHAAVDAYSLEVARRDSVFEKYDMKIRELVLSEGSVEIALKQAQAWVDYERGK